MLRQHLRYPLKIEISFFMSIMIIHILQFVHIVEYESDRPLILSVRVRVTQNVKCISIAKMSERILVTVKFQQLLLLYALRILLMYISRIKIEHLIVFSIVSSRYDLSHHPSVHHIHLALISNGKSVMSICKIFYEELRRQASTYPVHIVREYLTAHSHVFHVISKAVMLNLIPASYISAPQCLANIVSHINPEYTSVYPCQCSDTILQHQSVKVDCPHAEHNPLSVLSRLFLSFYIHGNPLIVLTKPQSESEITHDRSGSGFYECFDMLHITHIRKFSDFIRMTAVQSPVILKIGGYVSDAFIIICIFIHADNTHILPSINVDQRQLHIIII